jgi:hypothetical protein
MPKVPASSKGQARLIVSACLLTVQNEKHGRGCMMQSPVMKQTWRGEVCNGNVTDWLGVTCNMGKVTQLDLTSYVSGGLLPSQLYLLPNRTKFECFNCSMAGTNFAYIVMKPLYPTILALV